MPGLRAGEALRGGVRARRGRGASRRVMVLERHGLFTLGATAKESYERTIDAVTRAERVHRRVAAPHGEPRRGDASRRAARRGRRASVLPRLRGVAREARGRRAASAGRSCARARRARSSRFLARPDAATLVAKGCATPDHVIRTKPTALLVARSGVRRRRRRSRAQLEAAVAAYARDVRRVLRRDVRARRASRRRSSTRGRASSSFPGSASCALGATAARGRHRARRLRAHDRRDDERRRRRRVRARRRARTSSTSSTGASSRRSSKPAAPLPLSRCVALVTGAASGHRPGDRRAARSRRGRTSSLVDRDAEAPGAGGARAARGRQREERASWRSRPTCATRAAVERAFAHDRRDVGRRRPRRLERGRRAGGALDTAGGAAALRDSLELNCLVARRRSRAPRRR